jgi:hypothetical protein
MSVANDQAQLYVSTDGTAGPYIIVPVSLLDSVRRALSDGKISFTVDEDGVSLGGRPALSVLDLGHESDVARVQALLEGLGGRGYRPLRTEDAQPATSPDELILKGEPQQVEQLQMRIQSSTSGGWRRRFDLEERLKQMGVGREGTFCFSKQFEHIQNSEFVVWLKTRGASQLDVSNVVPSGRTKEFGYAEYNRVLTDFKENFIYKLIEGLRIHAIQVPISLGRNLLETLSPEALKRLKAFSETANRSRLHPLDIKRWNSFVVQTHTDESVIDSDLLDAWLADEGWPDPTRKRLVQEYQSARSLLTAYEEEHACR